MANRSFNRKQALEKEIKEIYAKVTIGSSGAPTLTTGYGVASITRTSAGLYQLTLADKYTSLKNMEVMFLSSTAQDIRAQIKAEDVDVAKTIDFFTLTDATATDPSSGQVMLIKLDLKNTSAV
jgi:hypothetical protein